MLAQDDYVTLPELAGTLEAATRVAVDAASIGRFLCKLGYTYKKPLVASERLRAHLKERRKNWFRHHLAAMQEHPDRLVFIDETSVKNNLTCQYGRSLCGKRLEMDAPFGAWGTQAFIVGLTHDHLIAPWVIKGAMDGEAFEVYV